MTEKEWLESSKPYLMLRFVGRIASARQLRLIACACTRRLWSSLLDYHRRMVEAAELYADGRISGEDMRSTFDPNDRTWVTGGHSAGYCTLIWNFSAVSVVCVAADNVAYGRSGRSRSSKAWKAIRDQERAAQSVLIRDIRGNPFRPVTLNPAWLSWNGGTIPKLAQAIYDERTFERLPVLADALEEAGCTDPDILSHCRGPGPHVKGCWVVDLLLGKS